MSNLGVTDDARWRDRPFANARFRCTGQRHTGQPCEGLGAEDLAA
jgi:hypothetical protein